MSDLFVEALKRINDPSLPDRAAILLQSSKASVQEAAVELLVNHPSPAALDRLWEIRCELEGDDSRFAYRIDVEAALAVCIKLKPEWLLRVVPQTEPPRQPFSALVYLLAQLEDVEGGEAVWRELREEVFTKTPPEDRRALLYASEAFRDAEAVERLRDSVNQDEDLIAAAALRALGLVDPPKAIAALEEAPFGTSLLLGRSWWLPQLLQHDYSRTSAVLRRRIEGHEHPWTAVSVYDGNENQITPEILDFLLEETHGRLKEAVQEAETEKKDRLARPFSFLSKVAAVPLLRRFEAKRETSFEALLTDYLVKQGPNDEGWYRWQVWDGISLLQKVGGQGFTQLSNYYLEAAQTRIGIRDGLLLGVQRPDSVTIGLVRKIADTPLLGVQKEDEFPLVQYEAVMALAALAQWRETAKGALRLGLKVPRSLPDYCEGHLWTDEELTEVLAELSSASPSPGAILMAGFSRRPLGSRLRAIYDEVAKDSEQALACLLALEYLGDPEAEDLFLENLDSPQNSWVAVRALHSLKSPRGDEALLERLSTIGGKSRSDQQLLAMNLLIRQETRARAAQLLWSHLTPDLIRYYTGDTLEYFGILDNPEVDEMLQAVAFSDQGDSGYEGSRHAAIKALIPSEPRDAFLAAKNLLLSNDRERLLCPETLLNIDLEAAVAVFREILPTTKDFPVLAAIGEALDRRESLSIIRGWLSDPSASARQGGSYVVESLRWSIELEEVLSPLLRDPSWDVRAASRAALEELWLSREAFRLTEEAVGEEDLSRRWTLVDAALTLGYPGVISGYGLPRWLGPMIDQQPYALRKHAFTKLEERRNKKKEELEKRERR